MDSTLQHLFSEKILPAVTFEDASKAVAVAQAIIDGGLNLMEVPFRTPEALKSIKAIRASIPQIAIGAGTILTVAQLQEAHQSGAHFGLAPGFNASVVKESIKLNIPFIPGVMTPSEVEQCLDLGCNILKLFPAAQVGGIDMLKALEGPYGHTGVQFIPMGGVTIENLHTFLAHKSVIAVGGSWLATKSLIAEAAYKKITQNVAEAVSVATSR